MVAEIIFSCIKADMDEKAYEESPKRVDIQHKIEETNKQYPHVV